MKTPEKLWFSGVFRGYKMGKLARNGLRNFAFQSLSKVMFKKNQSERVENTTGNLSFKVNIKST